jgi:hypothetical protein
MLKRTMHGRAGIELFALAFSMPPDANTPSTESAGEPNYGER